MAVKEKTMDKDIQALIYAAETTIKQIKEPQDPVAQMKSDSNIRNQYGLNPMFKQVGKVTVGPLCTPETLRALVNSDAQPHTIRQLDTW